MTRITYLDTARALLTRQDPKQFLFFTRTANGRRAGKEFLARLEERTSDRDKAISVGSFRAQLKAIHRWGHRDDRALARVVEQYQGARGRSIGTERVLGIDTVLFEFGQEIVAHRISARPGRRDARGAQPC